MRAVLQHVRDGFVGDHDDSDDLDEHHGEGGSDATPPRIDMAQDRRAWERHCEVVLRANGTLAVSEFLALLTARVDRAEADLAAQQAAQRQASSAASASEGFVGGGVGGGSRDARGGGDGREDAAQGASPLDAALSEGLAAWAHWTVGGSECGSEGGSDAERWADGVEALLWGDAAASAAADSCSPLEETITLPGAATSTAADAIAAVDAEDDGAAATSQHAARVAVHALVEIAVALRALASAPARDHLFPWRRPDGTVQGGREHLDRFHHGEAAEGRWANRGLEAPEAVAGRALECARQWRVRMIPH